MVPVPAESKPHRALHGRGRAYSARRFQLDAGVRMDGLQRTGPARVGALCGWGAAAACVAAAVIGGAMLDGYSHLLHPLALLGAGGVPGGRAFNAAGFVLPGLLAAVAALAMYRRLPRASGWWPRIGARMVLLSALAFAAQGLFPLDLQDLDGPGSGLHASAWLVWWIGFVAGAPLLAVGLRPVRTVTTVAVLPLLAMMLVPQGWTGPALAQRIAFAAWLAWLALAPWQGAAGGSAVADLEAQDDRGQQQGGDVGQDHRP